MLAEVIRNAGIWNTSYQVIRMQCSLRLAKSHAQQLTGSVHFLT